MAEEPQINKVYLSGTASEIKSNLTNAYSSYLLGKASQPHVIVINPLPPIGGERSEEPHVTLYYLQKSIDAKGEFGQIDGQTSFRLMGYGGTVTPEQAKILAEKIKSKFVTPLFYWDKGKQLVSYTDWKKGYQLQIGCPSLAEGRRIVEQVLDIQADSIDETKLNHKTVVNAVKKYPDIPDKKLAMGEQKRKRRYMAVGRVWFRHAFLTIPQLNETWTLVDVTGALPNPVIPCPILLPYYATDIRTYAKSSEVAS